MKKAEDKRLLAEGTPCINAGAFTLRNWKKSFSFPSALCPLPSAFQGGSLGNSHSLSPFKAEKISNIMSLTSFLQKPDVKERFRQEFPKPTIPRRKDPQAPSLTQNYSNLGTAFDYLLRFYLKSLNSHAISKEWIAEISLSLSVNARWRGSSLQTRVFNCFPS